MNWCFVMSANEAAGKILRMKNRQLNGFFGNKKGICISLHNDEFAVLCVPCISEV